MTLYVLDTEFIQDGSQSIDLISIGIVAEDGRTYYAESSEFDLSRCNSFVREQVLPKLGPVDKRKTRAQIKDEIVAFVGAEESPTFMAYYGAYDWVLFTELFGSFGSLPKAWPKLCWELKQFQLIAGFELLPKHTTGEHNALADAQWTMAAWKDLEAKGVKLPASVVGEKGRVSPVAAEATQPHPILPRIDEAGIFAFYGQIKSDVLGYTPEMLTQGEMSEAIGDNTVDNLVDQLKTATAVEVSHFVVGLLNSNSDSFSYAFNLPSYDGFKTATTAIVDRFRLMDGAEQGDLFTKIMLMFKDLTMAQYGELGTDAAELVAVKYARLMIDFLKSKAIQAADLSTDETGKYY